MSAGAVRSTVFVSSTIAQRLNTIQSVSLAGPGSTLLSYFVVGLFVYAVVMALSVSSNLFQDFYLTIIPR